MSEVQHIRSLVRQATLYRAQGLFAESRAKYEEVLSFLGSSHQLQNAEKLAETVQKRIEDVEGDIQERDLRDIVLGGQCLELSDDCTSNMVCWIRSGVSWTRKRITNLRLKRGLPRKKRIWS